MPRWSSAQLDLVVLTTATAGPRAVMDAVHYQDADAKRGRLGPEQGKPEVSRLEEQVETACLRARRNAILCLNY